MAEKRGVLSWLETRAVLRAFGIPLLPAIAARRSGEALAAAECLGFPAAMKILSAGLFDDPAFGPVVYFGTGGLAAEIQQDRAVALPPLNSHLARAMIAQTRIAQRLDSFRNQPAADKRALEQVLLSLSAMACELPPIQAIDIDPLVVDEDGAWALDARISVREPPPSQRPYDHMAIHPYPGHLASQFQLANGTAITLRPIRPEDAGIEQDFVRGLSPEAKYFRFMDTLRELSRDELIRLTQLDYARDLAFIATVKQDGQETEIGVARYFADPDGAGGEIGLAVADAWQHLGIGTKLMGCVIDAARERGFRGLHGEVLAGNAKMLRLMRKLGFSLQKKADEPGVVAVVKKL